MIHAPLELHRERERQVAGIFCSDLTQQTLGFSISPETVGLGRDSCYDQIIHCDISFVVLRKKYQTTTRNGFFPCLIFYVTKHFLCGA